MMTPTKNTNSHFWDSPRRDCNCMAYAFNYDGWMTPYDSDYEWDSSTDRFYDIYDMVLDGWSKEDIYEELLARDKEYMLKHFPNLREIEFKDLYTLPVETTVIAYRVGLQYCEDDVDSMYDWDCDFHFRVRRNGKWSEKYGSGEVVDCTMRPQDNWVLVEYPEDFVYDSRILLFVLDE